MSIFTNTTNGAKAYKATGSALVDLFFNIGASRNNPNGIAKNFDAAVADDALKASAILLWARDIRHGGAGERNVFRSLFKSLIESDQNMAEKVLRLIPDCGRFDDLTVAYGTPLESLAVAIWVDALNNKNALAFKWADRSDKRLQKALRMNEARLRKFISSGRKGTIVETAMCQNEWNGIEYGKLPSVAGMRYAKAFKKHDEARYTAFIGDKDTKVNAKVAYPYDVYRMYNNADQKDAASKYWENLPDLCAEGNILPLCDVSGSMCAIASGKVTCLDVSVSLGVYLAQKIKGAFNGKLMTFSESPTIVNLPKTKDIGDLFGFVNRMSWGMNTNIEKAYRAILAEAKKCNATNADMPKMLLILSDMAFDSCASGKTINQDIKDAFKKAGYDVPKLVYWNLNANYGNFPTMKSEKDVALVSGFSPKVLEAVLAAKEVTAVDVMEEAIKPFVEMLKK